MHSVIAFLFSGILILMNVIFLFGIVQYGHHMSYVIFPGLTLGILGFICMIMMAIFMTGAYVVLINTFSKD